MKSPFYAAAAVNRSAGGAIFLRAMRARAIAAPARANIARHLVLAYRPGWISLTDLDTIRRHVTDIDPTIETFIVPSTARNSVARRRAAARPTLVVSNGWMPDFRPARGKVYQGYPIPKPEELRRLAAAGVPIPRTAILTPDLRLDEAEWGEFVVVKPTDIPTSSHGRGFQLMRTRRVRFIAPSDYPPDHPGRLGPMMVQKYIDTGDHVSMYRVLTLFGEPLYCLFSRALAPRVDLTAPDDVIENSPVAGEAVGEHERVFRIDADALAIARAAHAAIPEIPLKGVDLIRDASDGRLYVLELNCGGNTWHFSSQHTAERRAKDGPEFELRRHQQFDGLRTAARVLVNKTNGEAE